MVVRILIVILPLFISIPTSYAAAPTVSNSHWAVETIKKWLERGWLLGYQDGGVQPDRRISRAEFIAFANRAFQLTEHNDTLPFSDVPSTHWAYKDIAIAHSYGYLKVDSIDRYSPNSQVTRQEVAYMLSRLLGLNEMDEYELPRYRDIHDVEPWAVQAVTVLSAHQVMQGDPNGYFRPLSTITRAEAITALENALIRQPVSPPHHTLSRLTVSANKRFLTKADGTPFFWLGDTAWELIHRANRSDVQTYLRDAANNGFSVVQTVILAELDGLTVPNAQGDLPLLDKDPAKPLTTSGNNPNDRTEYDYWDHLDYILDTAEENGLYIALWPTWGKYLWVNPNQPADPIFNRDNAYTYGKWLGERYGDRNNIIWTLGGDRIPDTEDKKEIIRSMAKGLEAGGGTQLTTYHPWGGKSSSEYFHNESWLDFNSFQSGHQYKEYPNYHMAGKDYTLFPTKPTFDMEPRYEHLPINFNPGNGAFDGYDVRQAAYWSVFAGAFGHTYGHNSIWQLYHSQRKSTFHASVPWTTALLSEGRVTLKWLRVLIESRPMLARIPDPSMITDSLSDGNRIIATRGHDYALIYSSKGHPFTVNMGLITGASVTATWFDPRTGKTTRIGEFDNVGSESFSPPTNGSGQDWVLILDDSAKGYMPPS